jgi:hypothetical protein
MRETREVSGESASSIREIPATAVLSGTTLERPEQLALFQERRIPDNPCRTRGNSLSVKTHDPARKLLRNALLCSNVLIPFWSTSSIFFSVAFSTGV